MGPDASDMLKWVQKQTEPPVRLIFGVAGLEEELNNPNDKWVMIVYFGKIENAEYKVFYNAAVKNLDAMFYVCEELECLAKYGLKSPSIMAFRRENMIENPVLYGMSMFDEDDIKTFSIWESLPLVFDLDERFNRPIFSD